MNKVWPAISAFLLGALSMLIIAIRYLLPETTVYKGKISMKQKGKGNVQDSEVWAETARDIERDKKKQARQQARNDKRADKLRKKIEKKAEKSAVRLEKTP